MKDELMESAMGILLTAGDARLCCNQALDALAKLEFTIARKRMEEAEEKMIQAHEYQTKVIQKEIEEEQSEYSLLFAHAMDTLMTTSSECMLSKKLISLYESLDQRIQSLEKGKTTV